MERQINFSNEANLCLKELLVALYTKEYFSFWDDAKVYVQCIVQYTVQYIGIIPGKNAPPYFDRYGFDLKYITYRANKATTSATSE